MEFFKQRNHFFPFFWGNPIKVGAVLTVVVPLYPHASMSGPQETLPYYEVTRRQYLQELSDINTFPNTVKPTHCYEVENYTAQEYSDKEDASTQWMFARYFLSQNSEEWKNKLGAATLEMLYRMLRADGAERFKSLRIFWMKAEKEALCDILDSNSIQFMCAFYDVTYEQMMFLLTTDTLGEWCSEWETVSDQCYRNVLAHKAAPLEFREKQGARPGYEDSVRSIFSEMTNFKNTNLCRLYSKDFGATVFLNPEKPDDGLTRLAPDKTPLKKMAVACGLSDQPTVADILAQRAEDDDVSEDMLSDSDI